MSFTIGSLFDGSGTAPLAATILGGTPLWASEIEPYPVAVTKARFPGMVHLGDITRINGAKVAPVDIIVGGSPCQDLSVAGKQAGLESGTRSNLFYEMTRIVREMRGATNGKYPRFVVWENVPGAFSSNKGRDFFSVVEAFCALADNDAHIPRPTEDKTGRLTWKNAGTVLGDGWSFAWRVIDAQYWGVPQRRRRIYAVLDLGSGRAGEILFERTRLPWNSEPCATAGEGSAADAVGRADRGSGVVGVDGYNLTTTGDASITIRAGKSDQDHVGCVVQEVKCLNPHDSQTMRVYDADGIYPALAANLNASHEQPILARGIFQNTGRGWWNEDDAAQTIRTPCGGDSTKANLAVEKPRRYVVRRLTPTECARLQGFPDWWTDRVPGSDSAKYKMWGNGMAFPCVLAVLNGIKAVMV